MNDVAISFIKELIEVTPKEELPSKLFDIIRLVGGKSAIAMLQIDPGRTTDEDLDNLVAMTIAYEITCVLDRDSLVKVLMEIG